MTATIPGQALFFAGIIEPWSDSFQPIARDAYGVVFSDIIWRTAQGDPTLASALRAADLNGPEDIEAGWQQRRESRCLAEKPANHRHFIAVTLGADILLCFDINSAPPFSVIPQRPLQLIGAGQLHDLFGECPGLEFIPVTLRPPRSAARTTAQLAGDQAATTNADFRHQS